MKFHQKIVRALVWTAFVLVALCGFAGVSSAEDASTPSAEMDCWGEAVNQREAKPAPSQSLTTQQILSVAQGVVPTSLKEHVTVGSRGDQSLWFRQRHENLQNINYAEGIRYEGRTVELYRVSIAASDFARLIAAVMENAHLGISAVQLSDSTIVGDLDFRLVRASSISIRLVFVDVNLFNSNVRGNRGSIFFQTENATGRGLKFDSVFSIQCMRAFQINVGGAQFASFVRLAGIQAYGLYAYDAQFRGGVHLRDIVTQEIMLDDASLGSEDVADWGSIQTDELRMSRVTGGSLSLSGLTIRKRTDMQGVVFQGSLTIQDSLLASDQNKSTWLEDKDAPVNFNGAAFGSLRFKNVQLPAGASFRDVKSQDVSLQLATAIEKTGQKDQLQPDDECHFYDSRLSFGGVLVGGWLEIRGADHLNIDLADARATYLNVRPAIDGKTSAGCLSVANMRSPHQFWAQPFPFAAAKVDLFSRHDLQTFRGQIEPNMGKEKADAWYRDMRRAHPSGWFDRWFNGWVLDYGTMALPPVLATIAAALVLIVAYISWSADALLVQPESFWAGSSLISASLYLLFGIQSVTPLSLMPDGIKMRPGVRWRFCPLELAVTVSKLIGLALLGGLLVTWFGYI
jgi:hypothetical protein